jgi:hypothetical protein
MQTVRKKLNEVEAQAQADRLTEIEEAKDDPASGEY